MACLSSSLFVCLFVMPYMLWLKVFCDAVLCGKGCLIAGIVTLIFDCFTWNNVLFWFGCFRYLVRFCTSFLPRVGSLAVPFPIGVGRIIGWDFDYMVPSC